MDMVVYTRPHNALRGTDPTTRFEVQTPTQEPSTTEFSVEPNDPETGR